MAFSFKTGSLSKRVFEATRSELFTLLTFLLTITFTLLSIISPLETISKKMWAPENPRHAKCSLPVAVHVSKTHVLKLTRDLEHTRFLSFETRTASKPEVNISHVKTVMSPRVLN